MGKRMPWWIAKGSPNPNQNLEVRRKISESNKGRVPWNKGQRGVYSEEALNMMAVKAKERWEDENYQEMMCDAFKGREPWNKGLPPEEQPFFGKHHLEESKHKVSEANKGKTGHYPPWNKGKSFSEETKRRISEALKGKFKGENNPHYGKHHSPQTLQLLSELARERLKNPENHPMYGKHRSEETIKKIRIARMHQKLPEYPTIPENRFMTMCEENNLPFEYVGDGAFWVGGLNPDFIDMENKKIVEIFGDYWHDPEQREVPFWSTEWGRKQALGQYGYDVLIIWEHELDDEKEVLEKVRRFVQ